MALGGGSCSSLVGWGPTSKIKISVLTAKGELSSSVYSHKCVSSSTIIKLFPPCHPYLDVAGDVAAIVFEMDREVRQDLTSSTSRVRSADAMKHETVKELTTAVYTCTHLRMVTCTT